MLDAQNAVAAAPAAIRREDYRPPEWLVPEIVLDFELGAEKTHGGARLEAMVARRMLGHQEPSGGVPAKALRQKKQPRRQK